MIFGINALAMRAGTAGGSEAYLQELVAHLALVDQENEYRLFVNAETESAFPVDAPHCQVIVAPRLAGGRHERWGVEQLWLPLAAQRSGARVLLCPSPA